MCTLLLCGYVLCAHYFVEITHVHIIALWICPLCTLCFVDITPVHTSIMLHDSF